MKSNKKQLNSFFKTNWEQTVVTFEVMALKHELLLGVYGYGFKDSSTIQKQAILPLV